MPHSPAPHDSVHGMVPLEAITPSARKMRNTYALKPGIPLYQEAIGMDVMSPFEVASGCDVVEIARRFPGLVMFGGIDKRALTGSRAGN